MHLCCSEWKRTLQHYFFHSLSEILCCIICTKSVQYVVPCQCKSKCSVLNARLKLPFSATFLEVKYMYLFFYFFFNCVCFQIILRLQNASKVSLFRRHMFCYLLFCRLQSIHNKFIRQKSNRIQSPTRLNQPQPNPKNIKRENYLTNPLFQVNPLSPKSDQHQISHCFFKRSGHKNYRHDQTR